MDTYTYNTAIALLGITQKKGKYISDKFFNMNVHSSFVFNNKQQETIQISIHRWTDKQTVLSPYSATLLSNEKERTVDTHYNMDESQSNC